MTTFRVSPPARKQTIQKSEHPEEIVPRLILAPFSPQAEVRFGDVVVNSVQSRPLIIFNPSISMTIHFTNMNSEDRISMSECKLQLNSHEEKQVFVSWSPVRSGYLRKVIRAQDSVRKAKSFEVILTGNAVNKGIQNSKKKRLKSEINTTEMSQKYSNATMTLNQTSNEKLYPDFRRETFSIEEKENRVPSLLNNRKKPVVKSNSPASDFNHLKVLNENSLVTNFSRFSSYDSVDAPTKYSSFESEFNASRHNFANGNLSGEMNLRRSTFSMDVKNHTFGPPKCSFSDSLEEEERSSTPTENITYRVKDDDVQMTPLKKLGDSSLFSPSDNLPVCTKSESDLSNIDISTMSHFSLKPSSKDAVMYISPPTKAILKPRRKSNDFLHRLGSSAIKDRKKHIRTNFSRRASPKNLLNNVQNRSVPFNASTVEKMKSQNPQILKQLVSSQCHFEDPFVQQLLYTNDQWVDEQEKDIIKWMNSILVPPANLCEEQTNWNVDGAEAWIKRNYSSDCGVISKKMPMSLYSGSEKLDILRKRKDALMKDELVKVVFGELSTQINRKIIFVREGRDIYADEGIKNKLLQLLACYNPLWLRIGLEAVYKQEIALQPKVDFGGLGLFIRKNVIVTSSFVKKTEREKETTRKSILLRFLQLIFFMDRARMQKLIRHNRCLFTLNSKFKSSQSLLAEFCADLVGGRRDVKKQLKDIGYELHFKQTCIDEYDYTVKSLKDLNDGIRLARLFEILFSEPNLCCKLRVPAIDIENKKYNIDVAMRAAKLRCTIKGNITAEDFVLVTRHGSRLKILSFLWQIIYNYLTPLYEKAAVKIQKWWRNCMKRSRALELRDAQSRNKCARVIQSAWKKYCIRKRLGQLVYQIRAERQKEEESARIIQTWFRASLKMKRDLIVYREKIEAAKVIQRWIRCKRQRAHFIALRNATIMMQRRIKAKKMMNDCRTHFLELKKSALIVQRRFRANMCMLAQRSEFLKLKNACINIQRRYRALKAMKKERESFTKLKQSVIFIQCSYRRLRLAKSEKNHYLKLRSAVITIQRRFRARKLMKLEQNKYDKIKQAVLKIQRSFRNYHAMLRTKNEFLTLKKNVVLVQRRYRANVEMKKCRNHFLLVKASVLTIQRWHRSYREAKVIRSQYIRLKTVVLKIQRLFRSKKLMRNERRRYMRLMWAAVEVQRQYRAKKSMKVQRERFLKLKWATLLIQRQFRGNRAAINERTRYVRVKNAALVIQRKYRAMALMRQQRAEYACIKSSAIRIQRTYRALQLMRVERGRFLKLKIAAIMIQQKYRAMKNMKQIRESYLLLKKSAIVFQRQWRMKLVRNRFLRMKRASIRIQRWWLHVKARRQRECQHKIVAELVKPVLSTEECAAIKIQSMWRGYCVRKKALIPKRKTSSDSKSTLPQSTLGERYKKAIYLIKTSDSYSVIFNCLWNLEKVTTFSAKLCEGVTLEGVVPIVFNLMARGNRSEPSLELYRAGVSILINLALYRPTKFEMWDMMDKEQDIGLVVHLMKVTHDKFTGTYSMDVFRYCTTFLWLICQEKPIAEFITALPLRIHLERMKISLQRKCPCQKNKQKRVARMLPKTQTNWYADAKTRTFDDNCFAISNLFDILYGCK